jgi:putative transposase
VHPILKSDLIGAAPLPTMQLMSARGQQYMPQYLRARIEGGTFFFTVTLADRSSDLLLRHIDHLRTSYKSVEGRHPFETIAICVLPDHIHAIWSLPSGDSNFPLRWSQIKSGFSRDLPRQGTTSASKLIKREKGIWQRRYWEHVIRNETDLQRHIDYIHYNPVKHGHVARVRDWPHSSFHRYVTRGDLPVDWGGDTREIAGEFGE